MARDTMYKVRTNRSERINQGDVFKNIIHIDSWEEFDNELKISRIHYPHIIILSQDCDLKEDSRVRSCTKNDKALVSVLAAPFYNLDHFVDGKHLLFLGIKARTFIKERKKGKLTTEYKNLIDNQAPRYHIIEFPPNTQLVKSVIDFKHYFSVSVEYIQRVKGVNFKCTLDSLYRERLSQRFANYLSRIGLPDGV